jgi:hypothetical protein
MTIKPDIRAKVIELHLQGMKRDDIQRNVGNISTGSIHNILEAYKSSGTGGGNSSSIANVTTTIDTAKAQKQTLQSGLPQSQPEPSPDATISTGIGMNKVGSPSSTAPRYSGVGQAITTTNVVTPRDGGRFMRLPIGGPLSHLLNEDMTVNSDSIVTSDVTTTIQDQKVVEDVNTAIRKQEYIQDIDFEDTLYPDFDIYTDPNAITTKDMMATVHLSAP